MGSRVFDGNPHPFQGARTFLPLMLLLAWWGISGIFMAKNGVFFFISFFQYLLGAIVIITLPWILLKFKLVDFSLDAILACATVVAVVAMLQAVLDPSQIFENITSTLGPNHAHLGLYMLIALAVALYRSHSRDGSWPSIVAFLAFVTILISGSRAAQTGSLAILFVHFFRKISVANFAKMLVVLILAGLAFVYIMEQRKGSTTKDDFTQEMRPDPNQEKFEIGNGVDVDKSAGRRLLMWFVSWKVITSSPDRFFLGIGFTNFRWEFGHLIILPFYTNAAHDVFLQVWTETGLVGLLLYLWIFISLIRFSLRQRKTNPEILLLAGLSIAMLLTGLTQETLYPNEAMCNINVFFFSACVILMSHQQMRSDSKRSG